MLFLKVFVRKFFGFVLKLNFINDKIIEWVEFFLWLGVFLMFIILSNRVIDLVLKIVIFGRKGFFCLIKF